MSSYETVVEKVKEEVKINFPNKDIKVIEPFYKDSNYIKLLSDKIKETISDIHYDHILFSYHGIPVSHLKISDPTNSHCYKKNNCCSIDSEAHKTCYKHQVIVTTELVAKYLDLEENKYSVSFQSRLANEPWLKPYTDSELERLAKDGKKNLVIVTPAFVTDCLETLEEIVMEGKEEFLDAGGENYYYVPCLNDDVEWVKVLSRWIDEWAIQTNSQVAHLGFAGKSLHATMQDFVNNIQFIQSDDIVVFVYTSIFRWRFKNNCFRQGVSTIEDQNKAHQNITKEQFDAYNRYLLYLSDPKEEDLWLRFLERYQCIRCHG